MALENVDFLLFLLGAASAIIFYLTVVSFVRYVKPEKVDMYKIVNGGIMPILIIGICMFLISAYIKVTMQMPEPYSYLILNPLMAASIVFMSFALVVWAKQDVHYVGLLALLTGLLTLYYGVAGYQLGITSVPTDFGILYASFGMVGILAFPVSLIMDIMPGMTKRHSRMWGAYLTLFWVFLAIGIATAFLAIVFNGP